ncbi:MAG: cytochrome c-type biogenesis protein CcmH [Sphingomonadaceae bacterium]|nr:cytochrome c-type biogenesis protein CcmH [Sphingomonadaceae bacterium]
MKRLAILLALFAPINGLRADSSMPAAEYANTQLPDPEKEKAARELMESIRCLVCQGQSIADSDADMAGDMRALIRERVGSGEKPEAVRSWLVERYGNWVTYDPPMQGVASVLWIAPLGFLLLGLFLARGRFRRRSKG